MASPSRHQLRIDDLSIVIDVLAPIAYKFKRFGTMIKVEHSKLMEIENSNGECVDKLYNVLEYRLKQLPLLTWQDIVRALRSPVVNEAALASEIESKYLQNSSSQSQEYNSGSSIPATSRMDFCSSQLDQPPRDERLCFQQIIVDKIVNRLSQFSQFKEHVKSLYQRSALENRKEVLKMKTPGKLYINLVCIDRKTDVLRREYDEITEAMVRNGNVDVIKGRKCPMDMNEIAKRLPHTLLESVVLVEGAPGVGKSTFSFEFCRRWMRGEIAQQYDLVLLLRLRDESIANANSWMELIHHFSSKVREAVIAMLDESGGKGVLLILEGYDELPESCRSGSSPFLQLISGEILPYATVMITSRPWATCDIFNKYSDHIFLHIEILGFTKAQIKSYIQNTLPKEEADDLEQSLQRHPQIRMCMYIPLNCAIVITVYNECKECDDSFPATLTELYSVLTRTILRRHLRSISSSDEYIADFNDLPSGIEEKFIFLCELAYKGIAEAGEQVKLIFTDLPADIDNLGFMDSVFEFYETRRNTASHNFLHLTFQEFLAAIHISKMESNKRLEHFRRHSEGRLAVVLRFLAGLIKMSDFQSSSDLIPLLKLLPKDDEDDEDNEDKYAYGAFIDYVVDDNLVSCLFEAGRGELVRETFCQGKIVRYFNPTGSLDVFALAFCIAHSQCKWVLSFKGEVKEDVIDSLSAVGGEIVGVTENSSNSISIQSLKYVIDCLPLTIHHLCFSNGGNWLEITLMRRVIYFQVNHSSDSVKISQCNPLIFLLPRIPKLTCITFCHPSLKMISSDDCKAIADFISQSVLLENLFIMKDEIDVECIGVIFEAISRNKSLPLKKLYLRGLCTKRESTISSLVQFIKNRTQPLQITLPYYISTTNALQLVRALEDNPHLTEQYKNCFQYQDIDTESNAISFIELMYKYPEMCSYDDPFISGGIRGYKITDVGVKHLAKALKLSNRHTINTLSLKNQHMGDEAVMMISEVLYFNTSLTKLDLSSNEIGSDGAVALATALRSNSMLIELDISFNKIGDEGADHLARALGSNRTLKKLDFSNNEICCGGGIALFRALLCVDCSLERIYLQGQCVSLFNKQTNMVSCLHSSMMSQDELSILTNHTLKELKLSIDDLDSDKIEVLAKYLCFCSALTTLDLSMERVSGDESTIFSALLNLNITKLKLSIQLSGGDAIKALSGILSTNKNLVTLDIGGLRFIPVPISNTAVTGSFEKGVFGNDGAKHLTKALTSNNTLRELDLSCNAIGDEGAEALARALNFNRTLMTLTLHGNEIGDEGAKAFAAVLDSDASPVHQELHHQEESSPQTCSGNTKLQELILSSNKIGDVGAKSLAQSLCHNHSLKSLHLQGNKGIGREGVCNLIEALNTNKSITTADNFRGLVLQLDWVDFIFFHPDYDALKERIQWDENF